MGGCDCECPPPPARTGRSFALAYAAVALQRDPTPFVPPRPSASAGVFTGKFAKKNGGSDFPVIFFKVQNDLRTYKKKAARGRKLFLTP